MLNPVDDDGSVTFDHIEDSLNPQKIFTPKYNQRLKPGIQRIAEDWLIDRQANLYMRIVPIDVIMIVRVVVATSDDHDCGGDDRAAPRKLPP